MSRSLPAWSIAAQNLSTIPKAETPRPLLISAEKGCLLEPFATRFLDKGNKLEKVDQHSISIRANGVFVTHCNVQCNRNSELAPYHLETMRRTPPLMNGSPFLNDDSAGQFRLRLYFPPLRDRKIDVLAWTYAFGIARANDQSRKQLLITPRLVYTMMYDSFWPGNERSLLYYLNSRYNKTSCVLDAVADRESSEPKKFPNFNELNPKNYQLASKHEPGSVRNWFCRQTDPFSVDKLPDVTLRMFFAAFHKAVRTNFIEQESVDLEPLGNPENWLNYESKLNVDGLKNATASELLSEYSFGLVPQSGWGAELLKQLDDFRFFGASLESLRNGIINVLNKKCGSLVTKLLSCASKADQSPQAGQPLSDLESQVINLMYGQGMTQTKAAKTLKAKKQSVSRAHSNAILKDPQIADLARNARKVKRQVFKDIEDRADWKEQFSHLDDD